MSLSCDKRVWSISANLECTIALPSKSFSTGSSIGLPKNTRHSLLNSSSVSIYHAYNHWHSLVRTGADSIVDPYIILYLSSE